MPSNPISIANVQTTDRNVNQLQQNISQAVNPIIKNPIVQGTILTTVNLSQGLNQVSHGLGRALVGWVPVRVRAATILWDTQDSNPSPNNTLYLNSSTAAVVDLYVF